jgi:hypothetical protein
MQKARRHISIHLSCPNPTVDGWVSLALRLAQPPASTRLVGLFLEHLKRILMLRLVVSTRFQVLLTRLLGVLFTFPSRY